MSVATDQIDHKADVTWVPLALTLYFGSGYQLGSIDAGSTSQVDQSGYGYPSKVINC